MKNFSLLPLRLTRRAASVAACVLVLGSATAAHAQTFGFATLAAVLLGNGTILRSNGVQASGFVAAGAYEVTFSRPVDTCIYSASLVGLTAGSVSVQPKSGAPAVLLVRTFNAAGAALSRASSIIVSCGP